MTKHNNRKGRPEDEQKTICIQILVYQVQYKKNKNKYCFKYSYRYSELTGNIGKGGIFLF